MIKQARIKNKKRLYTVGIGVLLTFLAVYLVHRPLFGSFYQSTAYQLLIPFLIGSYVSARGFRDGKEIGLLLLYWCWAILTRILTRDRPLWDSLQWLVGMGTMILFFSAGLILEAKDRDKLFFWTSVGTLIFCFFAGLACIWSAITRSFILYPPNNDGIGYESAETWRISFFTLHPNITAGIFVAAFCVALILLVQRKGCVLFRIWLGITLVIDYLTIALTLSRNGQTAACIALGLTVGILLLDRLKPRKLWGRLFIMILALLLVGGSVYQLYEPARKGLWTIYEKTQVKAVIVAEQDDHSAFAVSDEEDSSASATDKVSAGNESSTAEYQADDRSYLKSGRTKIFKAGIGSLRLEPKRLLFGSQTEAVMKFVHLYTKEPVVPHFHNAFLQTVNLVGLPGLLLVLVFCILILRNCAVVVLSPADRFPAEQKIYVLPIAAFLFYYLLEAGLFTDASFREAFFYFSAGILTGVYRQNKNQGE